MRMRLWKLFTLFNDDSEEIVFLGINCPRAHDRSLHALLHTHRQEPECLKDLGGASCCEFGCSEIGSGVADQPRMSLQDAKHQPRE
jgi:hypothetical protein